MSSSNHFKETIVLVFVILVIMLVHYIQCRVVNASVQHLSHHHTDSTIKGQEDLGIQLTMETTGQSLISSIWISLL